MKEEKKGTIEEETQKLCCFFDVMGQAQISEENNNISPEGNLGEKLLGQAQVWVSRKRAPKNQDEARSVLNTILHFEISESHPLKLGFTDSKLRRWFVSRWENLTAGFLGLRDYDPFKYTYEGNFVNPAYEIINVVGTETRRIGYWSNYLGLSVIHPEELHPKPANHSRSSRKLILLSAE